MLNQEQLQNVAGVVGTAQTILIMFTQDASFDQVASATGLFLALEQTGKNVSLLCPELVDQELSMLNGSDRVQTKLGRKHLHVIFDYKPESIDKVSYHINEENNKFYLVIQPQKGFPPLESESVSFDYAGADADLIILVGVNSLEDLGQLYFGYQSLFQDSATISINSFESDIANINMDLSSLSCMTEGAVELIESLGLELSGEVATNLLAGIEEKTESFHSLTTSPNTFEVAAKLLKAGARRIKRAKSQPQIFVTPVKEDKQNFVEVMKRRDKPETRSQKPENENHLPEQEGKPEATPLRPAQRDFAPPPLKASSFAEASKDEAAGHGQTSQDEEIRDNPLMLKALGGQERTKNEDESKSIVNKVQDRGETNHDKKKKKQKNNDQAKPGDLDYQPTGFGPGGDG